ncbi:MAG TPA: hypothetical protein VGL37_00160 [Solirubrobacteraceae bacterium]
MFIGGILFAGAPRACGPPAPPLGYDTISGLMEENTEIVPWDRKLAKRFASDAWVAANHPLEKRREPLFRQRVTSRAFSLGLLPIACVAVLSGRFSPAAFLRLFFGLPTSVRFRSRGSSSAGCGDYRITARPARIASNIA